MLLRFILQSATLALCLLPAAAFADTTIGANLRPNSLTISEVFVGRAAERADLHVGDVLLAADGQPLATYADLRAFLSSAAPGRTVSFTVFRSGAAITVPITLEQRDGDTAAPPAPIEPVSRTEDACSGSGKSVAGKVAAKACVEGLIAASDTLRAQGRSAEARITLERARSYEHFLSFGQQFSESSKIITRLDQLSAESASLPGNDDNGIADNRPGSPVSNGYSPPASYPRAEASVSDGDSKDTNLPQISLLLNEAMEQENVKHFARSCELFHSFYIAQPSYASLGPVEHAALDAMRRKLDPDGLMREMSAAQADPEATPATICSFAFTVYAMYFHDGNRAGSARSSELAMREYANAHGPAAPTATIPAPQVSRGGTLTPGKYGCSTFGGSIQLHGGGSTFTGGLTAAGNLTITGDTYSFDDGGSAPFGGKYRLNLDNKSVRFDGVLAHAFARLSAPSTDGVPSINFPQEENRTAIDGHPLAGGPMSCYHQR